MSYRDSLPTRGHGEICGGFVDAFLVSCDIIRLQLSLCRNLDQIEFSDIQFMRSDSISEPLLVETSRPLDPKEWMMI